MCLRSRRPPAIARFLRRVPLSGATGANPVSAAATSQVKVPILGISAISVLLATGPINEDPGISLPAAASCSRRPAPNTTVTISASYTKLIAMIWRPCLVKAYGLLLSIKFGTSINDCREQQAPIVSPLRSITSTERSANLTCNDVRLGSGDQS